MRNGSRLIALRLPLIALKVTFFDTYGARFEGAVEVEPA